MKRRDVKMKKINVLALMLALMLLLGGCAAKDDAVVIDVNGETMTKGAMNEQIDAQISYNQQLNALYQAYYGFSAGYPTDREEVAQTLADAYINTLVALQKAEEMGLDQFDEAEKATVETSAKAQFDGIIADVAASYFADFSGDEATEKAIAYAAEKGVTLESYIDSESKTLMLDKLEQEMVKDITISEEDAQAALEKRIEEDKALFDQNPLYFGDYVNQAYARPFYAPEGYRFVKHILVQFTESDLTIINQKRDALTQAAGNLGQAKNEGTDTTAAQAAMDEAQAAYDAAKADALKNIQPRLDEIMALATAEGADFDALVAQYNEDPGMPEMGYAICEGYPSFVESFVNAGMSLENIGDVSQPTPSDYGCHILKYISDVPAGAYETEKGLEEMKAEMLEDAQTAAFEEKLTQWISEAEVKTYLDRLK